MGLKAVYVPWLHFHQPLIWWKIKRKEELIGNLRKMLLSQDSNQSYNAKLMARAYKNPAKYVLNLRKEGYNPKIIVDFSAILLESLNKLSKEKWFKEISIEGEKLGDVMGLWKRVLNKYPDSIEFAGSSYSHCYFPVTPREDWDYQIEEWRNSFKKLFGKKILERIKGFWLPEMGTPGKEEDLALLIKLLKENGYEWLILPTEALEGEKKLSYEERIKITSRPHILKAKNQKIKVIFKVRYDFLDQQAGCDANGVYERCIKAAEIFKGKAPALVVPASDGENGNVMMNEFFPNTFVPFFKEKIDKKISSMLISEFLEKYYKKIRSEIKISEIGGSWAGGHSKWTVGDKRETINKRIRELSKKFHEIRKVTKNKKYEEAKKALLISETSCYTYWGTTFWFLQGMKTINYANQKINELI